MLVDEKLVDLDAPLAKTLSEAKVWLPNVYGRMTLRQMLLMTAGIPYVETHVEESIDDPFEICRSIEIVREPGTHYLYSIFSYALAGYFLARSVGIKKGITDFKDLAQLFLQLLDEKVLAPMGMDVAQPEEFQLFGRNHAKLGSGHARNGKSSLAMLPEGRVKVSITVTAHFLITEFQKGLSPSGRRIASGGRVSERFDISHSLGYDWGMGWFRDRTHGSLHASGQWADAVSAFRLDPVTGFGLSYILSVRDSTHLHFIEMDILSTSLVESAEKGCTEGTLSGMYNIFCAPYSYFHFAESYISLLVRISGSNGATALLSALKRVNKP